MLIIIEEINKQILKIMKNLFYSLVVILGLGLTSCGGSSESVPATDSTAVDSCRVDTCCVADSCKKDTVK